MGFLKEVLLNVLSQETASPSSSLRRQLWLSWQRPEACCRSDPGGSSLPAGPAPSQKQAVGPGDSRGPAHFGESLATSPVMFLKFVFENVAYYRDCLLRKPHAVDLDQDVPALAGGSHPFCRESCLHSPRLWEMRCYSCGCRRQEVQRKGCWALSLLQGWAWVGGWGGGCPSSWPSRGGHIQAGLPAALVQKRAELNKIQRPRLHIQIAPQPTPGLARVQGLLSKLSPGS